MKYFYLFVLFSVLYAQGQVQGKCFTDSNPLAYGVSHRIEFNDSTFEYAFEEGLISGIVKGTYKQEGAYLILKSAYQPTDYTLKSFEDLLYASSVPVFRIRILQDMQAVQVLVKNEDNTTYELKYSSESNFSNPASDNQNDTVVYLFSLPRNKEIIVTFPVSNATINFKTNEFDNIYSMDLTRFPQDLYYVFFTNQMLLVKKDKLCFVDGQKRPERKHKIKQTRKGIKIRNSKKINWFLSCANK